VIALALSVALAGAGVPAHTTDTVVLRGHPQLVHVYGERGSGDPVIVSSGDGGWIHLGPHVAETLAASGYFVVGFNVKAYLSSFTSDEQVLSVGDVPGDYRALVEYATRGSPRRAILIGVSEGAGLSVLAAADPATQRRVGGVIALGLPDRNELGWRWKDSLIYVTHGVPNEPTFSAGAIVSRMAPVPLAAIYSTRDEFVPESEVRSLMERASQPKRLWMVTASDHRFSDHVEEFDRTLLESIEWVRRNRPQS
jgi:pimeloyl-ACP methyl ester carboxylesterase